jgi:hypothetical protein
MRVGQTDAEAVQTASLNHQPHFAQLRHSPDDVCIENSLPGRCWY